MTFCSLCSPQAIGCSRFRLAAKLGVAATVGAQMPHNSTKGDMGYE